MKDSLQSDHCAEMLRALAEPLRLRIVDCLRGGPKSVSDIASTLKSEIVNVSHHLGILRNAKLVGSQRQGRFIVYHLSQDVFPAGSPASEHLDLGCCRLEIPKDDSPVLTQLAPVTPGEPVSPSGVPKKTTKSKRPDQVSGK